MTTIKRLDDTAAIPALTGAGSATGDLFLVFDVSAGVYKSMTRDQLMLGLLAGGVYAGANSPGIGHHFQQANDSEVFIYSDAAGQVVIDAFQASNAVTKFDLYLNKYGGAVYADQLRSNVRISVRDLTDVSIPLLVAGLTKAVRIIHGATVSSIEGVDYTGVGSYQPMRFKASVVSLVGADDIPVVTVGSSTAYFPGVGTTASAANAFLNSGSSPANQILRSTSSLAYKRDVETLEPDRADNVIENARPIWYRSTAPADNPDHGFYGLAAEELAEIDPRLVTWGYKDSDREIVELEPARPVMQRVVKQTKQEDGTVLTEESLEPAGGMLPPLTEVRLKDGAQLAPDGIDYGRLTVLLIDKARRQGELIAALSERLAAIEAKLG